MLKSRARNLFGLFSLVFSLQAHAVLDFGGEAIISSASIQVDNLKIDGNTISSENSNGDIVLNPNGTGGVQLPDLTASRVLTLDASSKLTASSVTTTTLGYLDATSSIQTQLNSKPNTATLSDNRLIRGDGTAAIQSSGITVGDDESISGASNVTITGELLPSVDGGGSVGASGAEFGGVFSGTFGSFTNSVTLASVTQALTLSGATDVAVNAGTTITLAPGAESGIKLVDGSEGTAGHVWTSTGVDGSGHWEAASGGGGGSSGINILQDQNPKAEDGTSGWTANAGTFTTTTSSPANGTRSFSWDATNTAQYMYSNLIAIPAGLQGQNCMVEYYYKGFDSNIYPFVSDNVLGAGNTIIGGNSSYALSASSGWTKRKLYFVCPSSGSLSFGFYAAGNAAIGYWDEVHLGSADITDYNGAIDYGTEAWTDNQNNATTSVKITRIGNRVFVDGTMSFTNGHTNSGVTVTIPAAYTMDSGTYGSNSFFKGSAVLNGVGSYDGTVWLSPGNTITIFFASPTSAGALSQSITTTSPFTWANGHKINFWSEWVVSGWSTTPAAALTSTQSGGTVSWTATAGQITSINSGGSYTTFSDADFATGVAYTGTATAPASTSTFGAKMSFLANVPYKFEVIAPMYFDGVSSNGKCIYRLTDGTNTLAHGMTADASSTGNADYHITSIEGEHTFTSDQTNLEIYLHAAKSTAGTYTCALDNSVTGYGGKAWIRAYPARQHHNVPVLVGSITTGYSGAKRNEDARITCSGASSISSQMGSWVSSVGNINASGICAVALDSSKWASAPYCQTTMTTCTAATGQWCFTNMSGSPSTSSVSVRCASDTGAACTSMTFDLRCSGPKLGN